MPTLARSQVPIASSVAGGGAQTQSPTSYEGKGGNCPEGGEPWIVQDWMRSLRRLVRWLIVSTLCVLRDTMPNGMKQIIRARKMGSLVLVLALT